MRFELIDAVLELSSDRIVAIKHVTAGEEYLQDHFPGFPVLPGVLMVEAMVQAARRLIAARAAGSEGAAGSSRHVLGAVRALKYGAMVRPGDTLRIEVSLTGPDDADAYACRGGATVIRPGDAPVASDAVQTPAPGRAACSGRFVMRPLRPGPGPLVPAG